MSLLFLGQVVFDALGQGQLGGVRDIADALVDGLVGLQKESTVSRHSIVIFHQLFLTSCMPTFFLDINRRITTNRRKRYQLVHVVVVDWSIIFSL